MRVPSTALDAESILPLVPSRPVVAAPDTCGRRTRQPTHSDPQQFEAGATDWRPQGSAVALHGTLEVKTFAPDIYPQKKYPLTPNRNPNPFVRGDVRVVFFRGSGVRRDRFEGGTLSCLIPPVCVDDVLIAWLHKRSQRCVAIVRYSLRRL